MVLCALADAYLAAGAPADGRVLGEPGTMHGLAVRIGAGGRAGSARGAGGRVHASLTWLEERGWVSEMVGLPRYGAHPRVVACPACRRRIEGHRAILAGCPDCRPVAANHVTLSPMAAALIRRGGLPSLNLNVLRRLAGDDCALRLYAWLCLSRLARIPCPARERDFTLPLGFLLVQGDRNVFRLRRQLERARGELLAAWPEAAELGLVMPAAFDASPPGQGTVHSATRSLFSSTT
jgi:hypothetical protein